MIRVLSLLPGATDIVVALGAAEALVGITHECDAPEATLPRVTGSAVDPLADPKTIDRAVRAADAAGEPLFTLDAAGIAALTPNVILTQALCDVCAVHEDDVRAIAERMPVRPAVVALSASTLEGVLTDVARVAEALGLVERGRALASRLEERMRTVHERLARAAAPRPRVAILEWTDPPFAAGHWVPQMVRRAGGTEVLGAAGARSRTVSVGEVAGARPEIVIVAPCGYGLTRAAAEARGLLRRGEWCWLTEARVWAIDANVLTSRPGPRLVDGIETLAAIMHPTLFPPPSSSAALEIEPLRAPLGAR